MHETLNPKITTWQKNKKVSDSKSQLIMYYSPTEVNLLYLELSSYREETPRSQVKRTYCCLTQVYSTLSIQHINYKVTFKAFGACQKFELAQLYLYLPVLLAQYLYLPVLRKEMKTCLPVKCSKISHVKSSVLHILILSHLY